MTNDIDEAAALIRYAAGDDPPRLAVILGSGLAAIADLVEAPRTQPYSALPGFPESRVPGHPNRLVFGRLTDLPVVFLQGRVHVYEGHGAAAMAVPIRALKRAGIEALVVTNAAGSLNPEIGPGRLMLIADHINLQPGNPLIGPNDDAIGPRFPSLREAYDPALRTRLRATAAANAIDLAEGIYLAVSGPSFETPAEIRAFQRLGADAVGMSTVAEVILARHCRLRVAAISVITNLGEGLAVTSPSHDETLAVTTIAAGDLGRLIAGFCGDLARG